MDNNVKSYRKPYVRPVKANWWTEKKFYVAYMLREATSVLGLFVALELMFIIAAPVLGINPRAFIANPVIILLNIVSLVAVLYHAYTWYNLMPKAVRVFMSNLPVISALNTKNDPTKLLPESMVVLGLWIGTIASSVVIFIAFWLLG
ncbi:MAG: fumarate reductase subunit C [Succinivibrionaceae bacterium]